MLTSYDWWPHLEVTNHWFKKMRSVIPGGCVAKHGLPSVSLKLAKYFIAAAIAGLQYTNTDHWDFYSMDARGGVFVTRVLHQWTMPFVVACVTKCAIAERLITASSQIHILDDPGMQLTPSDTSLQWSVIIIFESWPGTRGRKSLGRCQVRASRKAEIPVKGACSRW